MVPGASLWVHVSPASRCNSTAEELLEISSRTAPPRVTQEDVPSPYRAKDPLTSVATERQRDVLPLPLYGIFTGRAGHPEKIGGVKDSNVAKYKGVSQWERHPGFGIQCRRRGGRGIERKIICGLQSGEEGARNKVWSDQPDPGEHQRSGVLRRFLASPSGQRATSASTEDGARGPTHASAYAGPPSRHDRD